MPAVPIQLDKQRREFIEEFDRVSPYVDRIIERDIEKYRKGLFCIRVLDDEGKPVENAIVRAKLKKHEFKFGANSFMVGMYKDPDMQAQWEKEFANLFNYTVAGIFWHEYEPEQGQYRFDKDSSFLYRRPPIDEVIEFAKKYDLQVKGHCLVFHTDTPHWASTKKREMKMQLERFAKALGERYADDFVDLDVVNELCYIYKNCYPDSWEPSWPRNMPICDEPDHIKWSFDMAKRHFPNSRLFWNEPNMPTFGYKDFFGTRSYRYLELKHYLNQGIPIEGIGIQCHLYEDPTNYTDMLCSFNPLRLMEMFRVYSEFNLPIHISEVTLPTYSEDPESEEIQAELMKRLYKLWFSTEKMDSIVLWNFADGTSLEEIGNIKRGCFLRKDLSRKPSYEAIDKLINHEWQTEIEQKTAPDGRLYFEGFYGDYEIEVSTDGKHYKAVHPMGKEETGYHHDRNEYRSINLRETKITLR